MAAHSAAEKLVRSVVEDLQSKEFFPGNLELTLRSLVDLLSSSKQPLSVDRDATLSRGHQSDPLQGFYDCYMPTLAHVAADRHLNEGNLRTRPINVIKLTS